MSSLMSLPPRTLPDPTQTKVWQIYKLWQRQRITLWPTQRGSTEKLRRSWSGIGAVEIGDVGIGAVRIQAACSSVSPPAGSVMSGQQLAVAVSFTALHSRLTSLAVFL